MNSDAIWKLEKMHKDKVINAYDIILWDSDELMLKSSKLNKIPIFFATSDFRIDLKRTNSDYVDLLIKSTKNNVQIFFKTYSPVEARQMIGIGAQVQKKINLSLPLSKPSTAGIDYYVIQ